MPSITTLLLLWGILVPLGLYGWNTVDAALAESKHAKAIAAARVEVRNDEAKVCNGRVATIEAASQASAAALAQAQTRLEELTPLIEKREELIAVCKKSASCRDRSRL